MQASTHTHTQRILIIPITTKSLLHKCIAMSHNFSNGTTLNKYQRQPFSVPDNVTGRESEMASRKVWRKRILTKILLGSFQTRCRIDHIHINVTARTHWIPTQNMNGKPHTHTPSRWHPHMFYVYSKASHVLNYRLKEYNRKLYQTLYIEVTKK